MKPILTFLALVAVQPVLMADQAIDDFTVGNFNLSQSNAGSPAPSNETGLSTSNVVGGSRDVSITVDSNANAPITNLAVDKLAAALSFDSGPGVDGQATFSYDGDGAGLNLDLTAATAIVISVTSTDGDIPVTVTVDGTPSTLTFQDGVDPEPGTLTFPIADFAAAGLDDVDTISILFDPGLEVDFVVSLANITGTVTPSGGGGGGGGGATTGSEPATILIWCVGLGVLALWRRRTVIKPATGRLAEAAV